MLDLYRALAWPLRPLGLDPGRALMNACPDADALAKARADQYRFIEKRLAELMLADEDVPA